MKKFFWRVGLSALMTWFGYVPVRRWNLAQTWKWTGEEYWEPSFEEGMGPFEALKEDWASA